MEASEILLAAAAVWLAIGVTASILMGRRGHDAFGWLLIGSILGPLAIPLAIRTIREERTAAPRQIRMGGPGIGTVDVLAGLDGSDAARGALERAVQLFGDRIGRITLAAVIGHEGPGSGWSTEADATSTLRDEAEGFKEHDAGMIVLHGRPADALARYAAEQGFELVVVGRRGRGASKAILGSTSRRLSESPEIAVLIV